MRTFYLVATIIGTLLPCYFFGSFNTPAADDVVIPHGPPSIAGQITAASGRFIRVEEKPGEVSGSAKAHVRMTDSTRILHRAGGAGTVADLQLKRRVSVWFRGPVAESYPVQAAGGLIVIEPDSL